MSEVIPNFIGGEWVKSLAVDSRPVENPATRELLGRTPLSGASDVDAAVRAAASVFPAWRRTPAVERARVLFRLKGLLEQNADTISRTLTSEHGKNQLKVKGVRCVHEDGIERIMVTSWINVPNQT